MLGVGRMLLRRQRHDSLNPRVSLQQVFLWQVRLWHLASMLQKFLKLAWRHVLEILKLGLLDSELNPANDVIDRVLVNIVARVLDLDVDAVTGTIVSQYKVGAIVHVRNHGDAFLQVLSDRLIRQSVLETDEGDARRDLTQSRVNEHRGARRVAIMRLQEFVQ